MSCKKNFSFETLKTTLQDSIFTWDYFTDFEKVKTNVKKIEKELNLLNYLIGKENIEEEFLSLVEEYPKVRKILPILIAIRDDKLSSTPIITDMESLIPENKRYIFNDEIDENIKKELLLFFRETGLKDFFENKVVKNLVDYCIGVEVGFDTNARKNRTGTLMENIVGKYLQTYCSKNKNFSFIEQATQKRIKEFFKYDIEIDKNSRRFDFALYNKSINKLYLIEVNYYSGGGSKLKATAGEYQYLNDFLKAQNLTFIWITDGIGWFTALRPLEETFNHNDYVINLEMLKNGILEEICL
ncbi:type II restriction endonuclease [Aliarcobacter butzleri]|uniref:type II restriction endonuclease n=1 Tax=Aliarcobacter butzleri TaxID=28197 RepID=UPI003AF4877F